jgi:hypothetical protein
MLREEEGSGRDEIFNYCFEFCETKITNGINEKKRKKKCEISKTIT